MDLLNVHAIERQGVKTLGPGLRYALWLQGCPFDCSGCITPEAKAVTANKIYTIESICRDIVSSKCEGITISGGEPFLQAESLAKLLEKIHYRRPDMTVVIFTGFRIEELRSKEAVRVLNNADLLIDGRYIAQMNSGRGLRGSSNQRLIFLTDRLKPWKDELENGKRSLEITIRDGMTVAIGIPLKKIKTKNNYE